MHAIYIGEFVFSLISVSDADTHSHKPTRIYLKQENKKRKNEKTDRNSIKYSGAKKGGP